MRRFAFQLSLQQPPNARIKVAWIVAGTLAILAYYFVIVTDAHLDPFQRVPLGLTFNSMLEHLLHGQFDVSPEAVQYEGYIRDGKVYSYWGIFCAVLRLPLIAFPGGLKVDVTFLSCAIAAWIGTLVKLRTLFLMRQSIPWWLTVFTAIYIVFGSSEVGFLKAIIYQEIILWSSTIASLFLFQVIKSLVIGEFSERRLLWMAALAGLGLLTRVTFGVGMYAALSMLLLRIGITQRSLFSRKTLMPIGVLILAAAIASYVNYQRWDNPITFYDTSGYAMNSIYPDRRIREQTYGMFNIIRIPYSLEYYFDYFWIVSNNTSYILQGTHNRLFDIIELPPSSFLLTELFTFGVVVASVVTGCSPVRHPDRATFLLIGAGFCAQAGLILCAIATAYRYRQEFHPLFSLLLFVGLVCLRSVSTARLMRLRLPLLACLIISVVVAHVDLALYKLSPLGSYLLNAPHSVIEYYRWRLSLVH